MMVANIVATNFCPPSTGDIGDIHKHINSYPSMMLNPCSIAIFSPRLTAILTAGWVKPNFPARLVAVMPSSLIAQKNKRLQAAFLLELKSLIGHQSPGKAGS